MQSGATGLAPPGTWSLADGSLMSSDNAEPSRGDARDASAAWKHCRNVARDEGRTPDLYDLLSHSVRETQYSFPPHGWPSQIRMVTPVVSEMPSMVTDRYKACQTVAFCGVFPEIRRAWASVDNSLFLWRFDKWQDVPIEYSGEDQAILAVGLVKPRPGVFVEAIRYLLVICTTTDVVLLGVCCASSKPRDDKSGRHDKYDSEWDHLTIQPLPLYSVSSDNVPMVRVASSSSGRIFLGGSDGNLYEIKYSASDSWRQKRCAKVCLTGGMKRLLPSFLPSFLLGSPQALVDIVVDDWRNILYTRSQASIIHVYDLGIEGDDMPHKVAEVTDFLAEASRALSGREVFGRGAGDKKGAAVAYMAPIDPSESRRLQLITVTVDGRRLYWSTTSSRTSSKLCGPRPDRIRPEIARNAMPLSTSAAHGPHGSHHHVPARSLEVVAACYNSGTLLLAEAPRGESHTRIFLLSRDLTTPPVGTVTGAHVALTGLRESIAELETPISGEACAVVAAPTPGVSPTVVPRYWRGTSTSGFGASLGLVAGDVTALNVAPSQRFAVVTTAGVVELERLRPADILAQLLQDAERTKLELFFQAYGPPEAAAMCIQLAASGQPGTPSAVVAQAKDALDNPLLVGEPIVQDMNGKYDSGRSRNVVFGGRDEAAATFGERGTSHEEPALQHGGFDMGAVVPVEEPEWSGAHKGLCLYVARLLQPAWDEQLVVPSKTSPDLLLGTVSTDVLASLELRLRSLDVFLKDFIVRKKAKRRSIASSLASGTTSQLIDGTMQPMQKRQRLEDAARMELQRTEKLAALIARAADACFLFKVLIEHNISRLAARMDDAARARLKELKFRDWVTGEDGENVASTLIAVLISEHMGAAAGLADDLSLHLQAGCPSYFRESDRLYYNASSLLRRAEGATAATDRQGLLQDGVALLCKVPLSVELGQIVPRLALLRALDAAVELCARKAASLDPANVAETGPDEDARQSAKTKRGQACYVHITTMLKIISDPSLAAVSSWEAFQKSIAMDERPTLKRELLRNVAKSHDSFLQESVYAALIELNLTKDLLQMETVSLESFLVRSSGLGGAATGAPVGPLSTFQVACGEALARLYISRKEYAASAGVYELLASREGTVSENPDPSLEVRISDLHAAVLQARSCGDTALVDRLEAKSRLAILQGRLIVYISDLLKDFGDSEETWEEFCMSGAPQTRGTDASNQGISCKRNLELGREEAEMIVSDMKRSLFSIESLYNDVARPSHAWGTCLELVHLSGYGDVVYVRQLWNLFLKDEWERGYASASRFATKSRRNTLTAAESLEDLEGWTSGLQMAADSVAMLGEQFYPSETTFPAPSILMRLEQIAAGRWPHKASSIDIDSGVVHRAMLKACGGSYELVLRAYESVLSTRGGATAVEPEYAHTPEARLRLLASVKDLISTGYTSITEKILSGTSKLAVRRELGVLAAACEAYAAEARRLPQKEGDVIGEQLDTLGREVQQAIVKQQYQRYLD